MHDPEKHCPHSIDYCLAVNTLIAYVHLKMNNSHEALPYLEQAEQLIFLQVKYTLEDSKPP